MAVYQLISLDIELKVDMVVAENHPQNVLQALNRL